MKILYVVLLVAGPFVVRGQMVWRPGGGDSVRVMRPDGMACLVPDRAKVERMPVVRVRSGDRMPNALAMKPKRWELRMWPQP
ncbi:hypothetical protein [Puia dinghuensis]|nr:hypothetical protein [Puia dinghuensis]